MPTTGTPEPGGLGWYETLALIRRLAEKKRIVGMDLVEFSKTDNSDAPAFLCSKLIYKSLAYIFRDETPKIVGMSAVIIALNLLELLFPVISYVFLLFEQWIS